MTLPPRDCLTVRARSCSGSVDKKEVEKGAFVRGAHIYFRDGQREREIMPLAELPLKGAHNLENVLAGVSIGMLVGCQPEQIRHAVRNFKAVEHRLEFVARVAGVDYYNDSKATNVDATIKALESFPANIHLILGGKDKGSDYTVLHELLRQRVKRVYTIGAAAAKIESQIQGAAEIEHAETLENAVRRASESAVAGRCRLFWLPPAPASISFRATNIAAERSRRLCIRWRWLEPRRDSRPRLSKRAQLAPAKLEPTQLSPARIPGAKLLCVFRVSVVK